MAATAGISTQNLKETIAIRNQDGSTLGARQGVLAAGSTIYDFTVGINIDRYELPSHSRRSEQVFWNRAVVSRLDMLPLNTPVHVMGSQGGSGVSSPRKAHLLRTLYKLRVNNNILAFIYFVTNKREAIFLQN